MKRILFSALVLLAIASGSARAQSYEGYKVPVGSWPYAAFAQLVERGELEGYKPPFIAHELTRYGVAVALARWMSNHEQNDSFDKADKSSKDIICALGYEFEPEIARINGGQFPVRDSLGEKRAVTRASDWLNVWRNTPFGEERIQAPRLIKPPDLLIREQSHPQDLGSNPFIGVEQK